MKSRSQKFVLTLVAGLVLVLSFQNCNKMKIEDLAVEQSSLAKNDESDNQTHNSPIPDLPNDGSGSSPLDELIPGGSDSDNNDEVKQPSTPPGEGSGESGGGTKDEVKTPAAAPAPVEICQGTSCDLTPLTKKPAVTTVLLTLGDEANNQLVIKGGSSQLIAETIVRYSTPVHSPKILVVRDTEVNGESAQDTKYIYDVLLKRYAPDYKELSGSDYLKSTDIQGYDLVWYNNPGHPWASNKSYETLLKFKGAIVIQGDDMTRGKNFDISDLTGLKHADNGTSVICNGKAYAHDNNGGHQYRVSVTSSLFSAEDEALLQFRYGNDIDDSIPNRDGLEILATAIGGPKDCLEERPAIVRYLK